ncbi:hypothetical protein [Streptomyces sp. CT34]|uniref:hypothetical protein n=1 Tax=Streptomyces sp. CT34 TaxID=1553907 RepID=UPI001F52B38B|nr:hypothetical protein [Streptomyces sp. CT34]
MSPRSARNTFWTAGFDGIGTFIVFHSSASGTLLATSCSTCVPHCSWAFFFAASA